MKGHRKNAYRQMPSPERDRMAVAFGKALRARRTARRLSQEDFASLAGLDRTTPSLYERGLRQPTIASLFAIARALCVKPETLLEETRDHLRTDRS